MQRLTELKFIRISRYDSDKADNEIRQIEEDIKATQYDLDHLTEYAVAYYERIRDKYGKGKERRTELREFDNIEATKVAVTNAKLYVDRAEGFFGTLKEEFCNGRDWSRVGFDEFGKRLDAYIEWCVSGRLKEFDEGCRKTYDTIAGRRRRLGYTA